MQRLRDTNARRTGADDDDSQRTNVLRRPPLQTESAEDAREDGCAGALDVVVEAKVPLAVLVQEVRRLRIGF